MEDLTAYHDRLIELVQGEVDRLGCSRAEMAEHLELSPTALYKWLNRKIEGELSPGAIAALAEYFKCDRGALQEYLRTGKWPKVTNSPTLEDRVRELEATIKKLSEQSQAYKVLLAERSMPALSRTIQDAIWAKGLDWRDHSTIESLYKLFSTSTDSGGLGYRKAPEMKLQRLRDIVFGVVETTEPEDAVIAYLMTAFTGDEKWTTDYAQGLSEGSIPYQSLWTKNGKGVRT